MGLGQHDILFWNDVKCSLSVLLKYGGRMRTLNVDMKMRNWVF